MLSYCNRLQQNSYVCICTVREAESEFYCRWRCVPV